MCTLKTRKAVYSKEVWEEMMDIDFKKDWVRYKKLYNNLSINECKLLDEEYYKTHYEWECNCRDKITKLGIEQLEELKNWANNEKECAHYGISISKLFIVTIATSVIATQLVDFFESYSAIEIGFNPKFFSAIICIALFLLVFLGVISGYTYFFTRKANDARLMENYYSDIVQIIKYVKKKKISELRKKKHYNKRKN